MSLVLRIFIACIIAMFLLPATAISAELVREKRCFNRCLKAGHYGNECGMVCTVDPALGFPFNVAHRQFSCYESCYALKEQTALACAFECRKEVQESISGKRTVRFEESIEKVDEFIELESSKHEAEIDARLTSKEIPPKPGPVVIE